MRELVRLVAQHGLELHAAHLPEGVRGYYSPSERRIYFDMSLTPNERRGSIGHELGHFHHKHDCSTPDNERQADVYAARLLIHPDDYVAAARHASSREEIADALGLPEDIVEVFETHCLTRIGDVLYSSRGARGGTWRHRVNTQ